MDKNEEIIKLLKEYNQEHIIELLNKLDENKKEELLEQLKKLVIHKEYKKIKLNLYHI